MGNELWAVRYNHLSDGDDKAMAISIDEEGNVYVTGWSQGSGTQHDYATIKYDSEGNELWIARYNGPGNGMDSAWDITIDEFGDVYTGRSEGIATSYDYATVKYDSLGDELWTARYNGTGNGLDQPNGGVVVDEIGNVYVSGQSYGVITSYDFATVKYDTNGNTLWVSRYNGPGNGEENPHDITIDHYGNVYVTGSSQGISTRDYATVMYDADGNELWVRRYDGPVNDYDQAYALTVDTYQNVYVTGVSVGMGTGQDYATIKYSLPMLTVVPDTTYYHKGALGFTVTVANYTDSALFFQGWTAGETPWGLILSPLLGPINVVLGPHQIITPHISQWIRNYTPYGGPYIYTVMAGVYPDSVYAQDSFELYVVPPGMHQQYDDWEVVEGKQW